MDETNATRIATASLACWPLEGHGLSTPMQCQARFMGKRFDNWVKFDRPCRCSEKGEGGATIDEASRD